MIALGPPPVIAVVPTIARMILNCHRGWIRWSIRAQVTLSMHTSMDLPASQRVEQCSTKVRQLVQAVVGCNDLIVLAQQLLEQGRLIGVELSFLDLGRDTIVQVEPGNTQLLAAVLVDQLHRGLVFFGPLEVVARDVGAEDAPCEMVVLEKRRPGEANERGVRQGQTHVSGELAGLGAVCLVGNDDDVVAFAVWLSDRLIELMDKAEDEAVVLPEQLPQLVSGACPRGLLVAYPTPHEHPPALVVQVFAVASRRT